MVATISSGRTGFWVLAFLVLQAALALVVQEVLVDTADKADRADTEVGADVQEAVVPAAVQEAVHVAVVLEVVQAVAVVHTVLMVLDCLDYLEHLDT